MNNCNFSNNSPRLIPGLYVDFPLPKIKKFTSLNPKCLIGLTYFVITENNNRKKLKTDDNNNTINPPTLTVEYIRVFINEPKSIVFEMKLPFFFDFLATLFINIY